VTLSRTVALAAVLAALLPATRTLGRPQEGPPPAASATPSAAGQPPSDLNIQIVGAARPKIPIAVPAFETEGLGAELLSAARTLHDVVRDDLDFSGYFQIVPEEYYKLVRSTGDRRINYKDWLGVGADALLVGKAAFDQGGVVFDGLVYDTHEQRMVLGKRYRGGQDMVRAVAHRLSDEIVRQYTGQPGLAQTKIAFVSQTGKAKEIDVMDYDGARVKRITANGSINLSPSWSPDGNQIAFVSYRSGSPELMVLTSDGALRAAFPQSGELNSAPAWSPDGRLLAFASSRDGNTEIYTLRVADGSLTRLTRNDAIDTSPAWSPNGRELAFTSDRSGSPQIYIMDAEGANVRRLTFESGYCDAASWSPLGDRVLYTGRVPGGFDIYVKNLSSGAVNRLTENSNINEWPRWSPDGRHIVFASNRTGGFDIYTMDADGSRVRRLTHGGNNYSPSWSH
jgi:TolB protein